MPSDNRTNHTSDADRDDFARRVERRTKQERDQGNPTPLLSALVTEILR